MRSPTIEAISEATCLLMEASPRCETTTLEVKKLLRFLDFHITQKQVSDAMDEVTEALALYVKPVSEHGKEFRVFSCREVERVNEVKEPLFNFR